MRTTRFRPEFDRLESLRLLSSGLPSVPDLNLYGGDPADAPLVDSDTFQAEEDQIVQDCTANPGETYTEMDNGATKQQVIDQLNIARNRVLTSLDVQITASTIAVNRLNLFQGRISFMVMDERAQLAEIPSTLYFSPEAERLRNLITDQNQILYYIGVGRVAIQATIASANAQKDITNKAYDAAIEAVKSLNVAAEGEPESWYYWADSVQYADYANA